MGTGSGLAGGLGVVSGVDATSQLSSFEAALASDIIVPSRQAFKWYLSNV